MGRTVYFFIISFILLPGIRLELKAQSEPAEPPPVRIAFRTFMLQGSLSGPPLQLIDGARKQINVRVLNTHLSYATFNYYGPNPLLFYQEEELVASFTVPEGMREMILFFVERKNRVPGEPKFHITAMEADAVNFPLGSYLFINFSDLDIAAQIDKTRIQLGPQDQKLVTLSHENDTSITARFAERRNGEWVRSYQLAWFFQPNARRMVFLTQDDDVDQSLRLRTVTDRNYRPMPPEVEENDAETPP